MLRSLRDRTMLTNSIGAAFVDTYYRLSPPVADQVAARSPLLKQVVQFLLVPVLVAASMRLTSAGIGLFTTIGFAGAMRRSRRV